MAVVNIEVTITTNNLSQRYSKSWNSQNIEAIILLGLRLINKNPSYFASNGLKLSLMISYPSESESRSEGLEMAKIRVFGDYVSLEVFPECVFSLFSFFFAQLFLSFFWIGAPWTQISPRSWNDGTASLTLFFLYFNCF